MTTINAIMILVGLVSSLLATIFPFFDKQELDGTLREGVFAGMALLGFVKIAASIYYNVKSQNPTKPMLKSRAWWLGLAAVGVGVARLFGIEISEADAGQLVHQGAEVWASLGIALAGASAMFQRFIHKQKVQSKRAIPL